ncbi:hypothetical protein [Planococcus lenghuensis]|uniref:Uncharacterized protein n=1 Tax=Planococcus lenghuensis TaxID=2213202 RepID=A0A1Q2KVL3_9BACL|nr:hypothetical protein [Planococcus lenghuensis]AQQ51847.1 hypothetical protein B0X71_01080 [Planococcus lenghuensis]
MDGIRDVLWAFQMGVLLLAPLLLPLLFKKWVWARTVAAGYALYGLWGVYLHFTADITTYGTGYGLFIVPYLILMTIVGALVERKHQMQKR